MKNARPKRTKRPCRVCRKWYLPHPRVRSRQKTCGHPDCQRQWKQRGQAQWTKANPAYWSEKRLCEQLERIIDDDEVASSLARPAPLDKLPVELIRTKAGPLATTILLFSMRLLHRSMQDEMKEQVSDITKHIQRLPQIAADVAQVEIATKQRETTGDSDGLLPHSTQVEIAVVAASP